MENVIYYWLYWLIAAVISIFQGYRGYVAQKQMVELSEIDLTKEKVIFELNLKSNAEQNKNGDNEKVSVLKDEWINAQEKKFVIYAKTKYQTVCLRAIPYCFFYFITTLLGFSALFFAYFILSNTCNLDDISGGTAALIIFAILYGIIGITGQLPYLIEKGELPK